MKMLFPIGLIILVGWACTQQREITKPQDSVPAFSQDSTGYEITIVDPDFDRWYWMYYSPVHDRNNEYYRSMNNQGVSNWNQYYTRNKYSRVIDSYINYNQAEDYGIEVNRRLYWYFRYIEENFRIRLLR